MRQYFLTTARLGFSTWQVSDLDLARSLWGDPLVTKLICASGVFSEQEIKDRLQKEVDNERLHHVQYWPVFDLKTEELIGCCGLRPYDMAKGIYEIGFHIKSGHWGKKYAYEAAAAAIRYACDNLKAANLFAGHNPNNVASKKILERLGFHYSHDEFYAPTGLYHPSYKYY